MTETARTGVQAADVAWPEIERRLGAGAIAVLPIGAASKEHGYHLPMNTDALQAEWLAMVLCRSENLVVWPTLTYGYYPVFVDYPGSISLRRETFEALVRDLIDGIVAAGPRALALLNTGISTIEPLRSVLDAHAERSRLALVNVYEGPEFARAVREVEEQAWGGHADEIETSIMLAIARDRVAMDMAMPGVVRIVRGKFNRRDPGQPNYSPSGANGNPLLASVEKGEKLARAMLNDVRNALRRLAEG